MKAIFLFLLSLNCLASIEVLHYNIKEFQSSKIPTLSEVDEDNTTKKEYDQFNAFLNIVSKYNFDILSINEIQYDLPGVPNENFDTKGENVLSIAQSLKQKSGMDTKDYFTIFAKANTGNKALKTEDGNYAPDFTYPGAKDHLADEESFGIFPSQYATAGLSNLEVLNINVYRKIKWKKFNRNIDLSKFKTYKGNPYSEKMPLFDKSFTHVMADYNGELVHLVYFHTVPAVDFGRGETSPNMARNQDQLRFLEWFLTGKTDIQVKYKNLKHIPKGSHFIAMGDWNTDVNKLEHPGGHVLKRLFSKAQLASPKDKYTYFGESYYPDKYLSLLDYIVVSNTFRVTASSIPNPDPKRRELGCKEFYTEPADEGDKEAALAKAEVAKGRHLKKLKATESSKTREVAAYGNILRRTCFVKLNRDYFELKAASDHLPVYVRLELK